VLIYLFSRRKKIAKNRAPGESSHLGDHRPSMADAASYEWSLLEGGGEEL